MKITKKRKNRKQIISLVTKEVEKSFHGLFAGIHAQAKTLSGDISPEQQMELDKIAEELIRLKVRLTELVTEQVIQNMD